MQRIIGQLARQTRILFLIDASGALVTAFFLGIVWYNYWEYTGMPPAVLKMLAILALLFSSYSGFCFLFLKNRWPSFIKGIAVANLFYCILTASLLVIYAAQLSILGMIYFVAELLVIAMLAWIEFKVAATIRA